MSQYSHNTVDISNQNTTWTKIFNQISEKSTVLDIGCSSGYFAEVLIKNKKCVVDGIELNIDDAKKAAKICRKVTTGNIEDKELLNNVSTQYDFIVFADVIEHLVNPAAVLSKVAKLLKKDGRIIFSVPNMAHLSVILELLNGTFDYEETGLLDRTHLHFYTRKTILEIVKDSGLFITDLEFSSYDVPRHIVQKGLKKIGLKAENSFFENIEKNDFLAYQYIATISKNNSDGSFEHSKVAFKATHQNDEDRKLMMNHITNLEKLNRQLVNENKILSTKSGMLLKKLHRKK